MFDPLRYSPVPASPLASRAPSPVMAAVAPKRPYNCRRCGQPKAGHLCTAPPPAKKPKGKVASDDESDDDEPQYEIGEEVWAHVSRPSLGDGVFKAVVKGFKASDPTSVLLIFIATESGETNPLLLPNKAYTPTDRIAKLNSKKIFKFQTRSHKKVVVDDEDDDDAATQGSDDEEEKKKQEEEKKKKKKGPNEKKRKKEPPVVTTASVDAFGDVFGSNADTILGAFKATIDTKVQEATASAVAKALADQKASLQAEHGAQLATLQDMNKKLKTEAEAYASKLQMSDSTRIAELWAIYDEATARIVEMYTDKLNELHSRPSGGGTVSQEAYGFEDKGVVVFLNDAAQIKVKEAVEVWKTDPTRTFSRAYDAQTSGGFFTYALSFVNSAILQTNESTQQVRELTLKPRSATLSSGPVDRLVNELKLPLQDSNGDFVFQDLYDRVQAVGVKSEVLKRSASESTNICGMYNVFSSSFSKKTLNEGSDGIEWFQPSLLLHFLEIGKSKVENKKKSGCSLCTSAHCKCSVMPPCPCTWCVASPAPQSDLEAKPAVFVVWAHGTGDVASIQADPSGLNMHFSRNNNAKGPGVYIASNDYVPREWAGRSGGGRIVMGVIVDTGKQHYMQRYRMTGHWYNEPNDWNNDKVPHAIISRNAQLDGICPLGDVKCL